MIISLDIETSGLAINTDIHFVGLYMVNKNGKELFKMFTFPQDAERCRAFLENLKEKGCHFVAHNGKFDSARLKYNYGIDVRIDHDTMILGYLMSSVDELKDNRGKWLGLKAMAQRILGVEDWDIGKDKMSTDPEKVKPYLILDCKYCYMLYKWFAKRFPRSLEPTYRLVMNATQAYRDVECNGLPIDMDGLHRLTEETAIQIEETKKILAGFKDINWGSSRQLSQYLYEELGLPIYSYTKSHQPSTGVEALSELDGVHPVIKPLMELRRLEKVMSFCEQWEEAAIVHKDGHHYVHSNFNMHGTVTGRTSSSDVNLQQIPRNKALKSLFRSNDPEWEMVCMDYSQLELRFAGLVANVKAIKDSYRIGEDLHYKMASIVTGKDPKDITKEERTRAKAANFGFLYGMSAKSFVEYAHTSYGVRVTQEEADQIRYHFFELYPELNDYYARVREDMLDDGCQTSIMGREYRVNPEKLLNQFVREDYLRAAINFPVQSAGSDYVISGLIQVCRDPLLKDNVRIGATVHDSIIALVRKDFRFYDYINRMKEIMESPKIALDMIKVKPDFPIVVDVEIGPLGKGVSPDEYYQKWADETLPF